MTQVPYINTTASEPVEFIPIIQDVDTYRRVQLGDIAKDMAALERRATEVRIKQRDGRSDHEPDNAGFEDEAAMIEREREEVISQREFVERNIKTMQETYPKPQTFMIAVPTTIEREQVNSRLVSLGLSQVTQEQIRATMIEELYNQDWRPAGHVGEWGPGDNEGAAEDRANFLDSCWLRQGAHDAAIAAWEEQEVERVTDESEGAPRRERPPMPPKIISVREQARMELLVGDMMTRSQRLRDLAASNMDFSRRNAMLLVRMHVMSVNFETTVPIERDRYTRALPEAAAAALREAMDDQSWASLVMFIDRLYKVDGSEEKNSGSRHENLPLPDGSIEPSVSPASNGGNSTSSSSSPAPAGASETTTDKSSGSTTGSEAAADSSPVKPSLTVVD